MKKACSCNGKLTLTTWDSVDRNSQIATFCVNLIHVAKAYKDISLYSNLLTKTAKDLFNCNLKGKTIYGSNHKFTWKRILEDNVK